MMFCYQCEQGKIFQSPFSGTSGKTLGEALARRRPSPQGRGTALLDTEEHYKNIMEHHDLSQLQADLNDLTSERRPVTH